MTREEFKQQWESDDNGGGITFDDTADCAVSRGICTNPRVRPMRQVPALVLQAAGVEG